MPNQNDNQDDPRPGRKMLSEGRQAFKTKWGAEVAETGFVMVPTLLVRKLPELEVSATQFHLLIVLLQFWWEPDKMPFPSVARLARLTGLSERTVQRNTSALGKAGLIRVRQSRKPNAELATNIYDLSPLVARLQELARAELQKRAKRNSGDLLEMDDIELIQDADPDGGGSNEGM